MCRGIRIKPPEPLAEFATWQVVGVPVMTVLVLAISVVIALILSRTVYGRACWRWARTCAPPGWPA